MLCLFHIFLPADKLAQLRKYSYVSKSSTTMNHLLIIDKYMQRRLISPTKKKHLRTRGGKQQRPIFHLHKCENTAQHETRDPCDTPGIRNSQFARTNCPITRINSLTRILSHQINIFVEIVACANYCDSGTCRSISSLSRQQVS